MCIRSIGSVLQLEVCSSVCVHAHGCLCMYKLCIMFMYLFMYKYVHKYVYMSIGYMCACMPVYNLLCA